MFRIVLDRIDVKYLIFPYLHPKIAGKKKLRDNTRRLLICTYKLIDCWLLKQVENGCMWFVPGSHKMPLRPHRPTKPGHHVLMTDECSNVSLVVMEFLNTNSPSTQCVGGLANQVKALRKGDNFFFAHIWVCKMVFVCKVVTNR